MGLFHIWINAIFKIYEKHEYLQPFKAEFKEFEPRLDAVQTWLISHKFMFSVSRFELAVN